MSVLYPFKFLPRYKEKVWGGQKLKQLLHRSPDTCSNCGESWELSGVPGDVSVVANGFLSGNPLDELVEVYMGDLVGDQVYADSGVAFPLLFKLLDTAQALSVQVHPDDSLAKIRHQSNGKAEMWYVLDAQPGASLFLGFAEDTSPEEFRKALQEGRIKKLLREEKVKAGDVFYVPPGQIHAIGGGITLCEIQQSSDITYRLYDWERPGTDGKPRKLHIEEAMEAIDFGAADLRVRYREEMNVPVGLVASNYFTTRLIGFDKKLEQDYLFVDSFVVYMCLEGSFQIRYAGGTEKVAKGETVMLPAELNVVELLPEGYCRLLETYIA